MMNQSEEARNYVVKCIRLLFFSKKTTVSGINYFFCTRLTSPVLCSSFIMALMPGDSLSGPLLPKKEKFINPHVNGLGINSSTVESLSLIMWM